MNGLVGVVVVQADGDVLGRRCPAGSGPTSRRARPTTRAPAASAGRADRGDVAAPDAGRGGTGLVGSLGHLLRHRGVPPVSVAMGTTLGVPRPSATWGRHLRSGRRRPQTRPGATPDDAGRWRAHHGEMSDASAPGLSRARPPLQAARGAWRGPRRDTPPRSWSPARPAWARPGWSPSSWPGASGVLAGACVPLVGEPLPYAALTQALRAGLGVVRQEIERSPELARLLPGTEADPTDRRRPTAGPGRPRLRLFQAVLALLAGMGADASRRARRRGRALGRPLHPGPAGLPGHEPHRRTRPAACSRYRTDSVDRHDPLVALAGRAGAAAPTTERVVLDRLDHAEATELVTALTGQAPDPERLEDTLARSAGNPLFVEQLVLAGEQDGPLPATLHGLLESRVADASGGDPSAAGRSRRDRSGGVGAAAGPGPRGRRRVRRGRPAGRP